MGVRLRGLIVVLWGAACHFRASRLRSDTLIRRPRSSTSDETAASLDGHTATEISTPSQRLSGRGWAGSARSADHPLGRGRRGKPRGRPAAASSGRIVLLSKPIAHTCRLATRPIVLRRRCRRSDRVGLSVCAAKRSQPALSIRVALSATTRLRAHSPVTVRGGVRRFVAVRRPSYERHREPRHGTLEGGSSADLCIGFCLGNTRAILDECGSLRGGFAVIVQTAR